MPFIFTPGSQRHLQDLHRTPPSRLLPPLAGIFPFPSVLAPPIPTSSASVEDATFIFVLFSFPFSLSGKDRILWSPS